MSSDYNREKHEYTGLFGILDGVQHLDCLTLAQTCHDAGDNAKYLSIRGAGLNKGYDDSHLDRLVAVPSDVTALCFPDV